jgi:hypothetical protein
VTILNFHFLIPIEVILLIITFEHSPVSWLEIFFALSLLVLIALGIYVRSA